MSLCSRIRRLYVYLPEQRLAEALKVMIEEVGGTIEWAKDQLNAFPKAKKDLGPLLDALGREYYAEK